MEKANIKGVEYLLHIECPYCNEENETTVPDLYIGTDKEECWNCGREFAYEFDCSDIR